MFEEQAIFERNNKARKPRISSSKICCGMMYIYFQNSSKKNNDNRNNKISLAQRHALYVEVRFCPFCGYRLNKINKIYSDCFKGDMVDMIYIEFP